MHILIAEARQSTRAAMRALFEHDSRWTRITEAADAQDVLRALLQGPAILLLDWGLPGMPAKALVDQVRKTRPDLVIVALGHHAPTRQASLDAGADCFIDTNHPPADFLELLHRLCPETRAAIGASPGG